MAVQLVTTSYGRPALEELRRVVADAKADDPMRTVTIIVPNNLAGIVARRHLAHGLADGSPGVAALHITTLSRLAEQLVAHRLTPRRPATGPIVSAAWRKVLREEPGVFEEVADHPATVRALASAHRELRDVSSAGREKIREVTTITPDLVRLHEQVVANLEAEWYDATDLLLAAADLVAGDAGPSELGHLVLYLPQDLDQAEASFATSLAARSALIVIAGLTGVRRADAAVERTLARLGLEPPAPPTIATAHEILNASDSDDEVRCVVRDLVETLKRAPAHRVAVLYAATSPYARLLHEHLAAAQLNVNGSGTRAVDERAVARVLLDVLALADGDVPRAEMFRALSNAPTRTFTGERIPISRWERISREAGVVSGDDWMTRLDGLVDRERAAIRTEESNDDPIQWRIERSRRTIDTANELKEFATALRHELGRAAAMTRWAELGAWCLDVFTTLLGEGNDLLRLPPEEQYAAATVTTLLRGLGGLDTVDESASFQGLRELLALELAQALPRVGRFGEGVLVAPISHAIGLDLDAVYVLGLSEDLYPGRLHEDPLLPQRVRVASGGELPSYRERLHTRHRHLLAAFAAAPRCVASFPRGDLRRSSRRLPSRWLLPSLRELSDDKQLAASDWEKADLQGHLTTSGSYAGELLTTTTLAHEQEWRVRTARAGRDLDDDIVRAGVEMVRSRHSARFTRFDGNLTAVEGLPDYAHGERVISPTALEGYAECPHAFLVQRLLGVEPLEQPEDIVEISPADVGNIVHESLDRLVTAYAGKLPGHGEPWSDEQRAGLVEIAEETMRVFEERGLTGHPRLWEREKVRILADLGWLIDDDNEWRAENGARVEASELTFGMRGRPAVEVPVPGGRMRMRGSADKVDVGADGTIYVTDVKTGSRRTFRDIKQEDPFVDGTKLQLPVYAYAARTRFGDPATPVHTAYWFVRPKRTDPGNRCRIGFELTPEIETEYAATLATLTSSIHAGLFPLRAPDQPDFAWVQCHYCNPDGIGHAANREAWERKRHDPVLRNLVALLEPDVHEEVDS